MVEHTAEDDQVKSESRNVPPEGVELGLALEEIEGVMGGNVPEVFEVNTVSRLHSFNLGRRIEGIDGDDLAGFTSLEKHGNKALHGPDIVHLYQRLSAWWRADTVAEDTLFGVVGADQYLPRIVTPEGSTRDIVQPRVVWREIDRDSNDDLSDGDGPRFVILEPATENARLRIDTDRLGCFQAFSAR